MRLRAPGPASGGGSPAERLIPLIDVVFFLLLFYLLTATLPRPLPVPLDPVRAAGEEAAESPRDLVVSAAGSVHFGPLSGEAALSAARAADIRRLRADRAAEAQAVLRALQRLQEGRAVRIDLVTAEP